MGKKKVLLAIAMVSGGMEEMVEVIISLVMAEVIIEGQILYNIIIKQRQSV